MKLHLSSLDNKLVTYTSRADELNKFKAGDLERAALLEISAPSRRQQFLLGRSAAHAALNLLGISDPIDIARGQGGAPIWPNGIVGSIAHTLSIGAACVGRSSSFSGIGIDIETTTRKFEPGIRNKIAFGPELEWLSPATTDQTKRRLLALFCAKESIYKAFFPLTKKHMSFNSVVLSWDNDCRCFYGRLLAALSSDYRDGFAFSVSIHEQDENLIAVTVLPFLGCDTLY